MPVYEKKTNLEVPLYNKDGDFFIIDNIDYSDNKGRRIFMDSIQSYNSIPLDVKKIRFSDANLFEKLFILYPFVETVKVFYKKDFCLYEKDLNFKNKLYLKKILISNPLEDDINMDLIISIENCPLIKKVSDIKYDCYISRIIFSNFHYETSIDCNVSSIEIHNSATIEKGIIVDDLYVDNSKNYVNDIIIDNYGKISSINITKYQSNYKQPIFENKDIFINNYGIIDFKNYIIYNIFEKKYNHLFFKEIEEIPSILLKENPILVHIDHFIKNTKEHKEILCENNLIVFSNKKEILSYSSLKCKNLLLFLNEELSEDDINFLKEIVISDKLFIVSKVEDIKSIPEFFNKDFCEYFYNEFLNFMKFSRYRFSSISSNEDEQDDEFAIGFIDLLDGEF